MARDEDERVHENIARAWWDTTREAERARGEFVVFEGRSFDELTVQQRDLLRDVVADLEERQFILRQRAAY
jgi:hypothetical protein